jgi:hypothetical protein
MHAIRKCDYVYGPALFLSWKDCSFYLDDPDKNDSPVEYKEFETLQAAFDYFSNYLEPERKETIARKRTAQEASLDSSASPLPSKKQKTTPAKRKVLATKVLL